MKPLTSLRALIQRNRDPEVIDFEAIKGVRARLQPGDGLIDEEAPKAVRCSIRALAYAEAAAAANTAGAYRRAARRVHAIYRLEFRHVGILRLAEMLQAYADLLKERSRRVVH